MIVCGAVGNSEDSLKLVSPVTSPPSSMVQGWMLHADLGRDFTVCEELVQHLWASPQRIAAWY